MHASTSLFSPGHNCQTVAHAHRVALLVDGEAYFRAFSQAAERATQSILILAWDFHSGMRLRFDDQGAQRSEGPQRLGEFLNWLVERRRGLRVRVLNWDYPLLFGTDREFPPVYGLDWKPHRRIELVYDDTSPVGGSHHQKVVVVDDVLAFVGGFDLTQQRWDTSEHRADELRRCNGTTPYPPFHDVMAVVDGAAARALGELARGRWLAATGQILAPVQSMCDPWPGHLRPDLVHVPVAMARTSPAGAGRTEVREVEQLYLDMIARAQHAIYIENQYFTAARVGAALAARLAEPHGPEIVLVTRLLSHGWLEQYTMHILRVRLIQKLNQADRYGRFKAYYAHVDGLPTDMCIDVHSKLMIIDDEVLRIGSANLSNRSMGMDTECDIALEARADARLTAAIARFRDRLLSEHLGVTPEQLARECAHHPSLHGAIAALQGGNRSLRLLDDLPDWSATILNLCMVADPQRPALLDDLMEEFAPATVAPRSSLPLAKIAAAVTAAVTLAALWRFTPLAQWLSADTVTEWAREFAARPWAPLVVLLAYTPACVLMFPRPLITLGAVVAFGPWRGFGYAMAGILLAAYLSYVAGQYLPRDAVRRLAGRRFHAVTATLRRHGLVAMTALRLVPLAPFVVEGVVAGAIGIKCRHFLLGTFFGMLPGTLAATVFADQLEAALRDPATVNYGLLAAVAALGVLLTLVVQRWLLARHPRAQPERS